MPAVLRAQVDPERVGLSPAGLDRVRDWLEAERAAGAIPGAVAVVTRGGRVAWTLAVGHHRVGGAPIGTDALFRIYSMTKPVVAAVTLVLCERGLLALDDPVRRHLPELGGLPVAGGGPPGEITVRDLLRHTSGLVGGYAGPAELLRRYADAGIVAFDHTAVGRAGTSRELVTALAGLPLLSRPGTRWEYGRSADVLGRLLEVAGGDRLDRLVGAVLLDPLGMTDTGFAVPQAQAHRVVDPVAPFTPGHPVLTLTESPPFLSAGSGLYSTAADYLRFLDMLRSGGLGPRGRVLSARSVREMVADQLPPDVDHGSDWIPGDGYGFGLGLAVPAAGAAPGGPSDRWWLGRASTSFLVDPVTDLTAVLMTQRYWSARDYQETFRRAVLASVTR